MDIEQFEQTLRGLLHGQYSSLSLTFNDGSAPNYQSVADHDDEEMASGNPFYDWVSEDERQKARAENSQWMLQWYPNTPIGFNCIAASSISALLRYLSEESQRVG